jgi:RNase P/RNase MRP subunit p29
VADDLAVHGAHHCIITSLNKATSGTISAVVIENVVKVLVYMYGNSQQRVIDKQRLTFQVEQNSIGTDKIRPK